MRLRGGEMMIHRCQVWCKEANVVEINKDKIKGNISTPGRAFTWGCCDQMTVYVHVWCACSGAGIERIYRQQTVCYSCTKTIKGDTRRVNRKLSASPRPSYIYYYLASSVLPRQQVFGSYYIVTTLCFLVLSVFWNHLCILPKVIYTRLFIHKFMVWNFGEKIVTGSTVYPMI